MLFILFEEVPCIVTAHSGNAVLFNASCCFLPKLITCIVIALFHMGYSFQKGISQPFLGIFRKLKMHCKGHELGYTMSATVSAINALLIIEYPESPHFYHFNYLQWNADSHMQYFLKPCLICLVELILKN